MTNKQERHIVATLGTIVFMVLVFLLLWVLRLSAVVPEPEEGIEIEFAEVEDIEEPSSYAGAYSPEPTEAAPAAPACPAEVATDPHPASPAEHILSAEETLALERARKEKEEREAAERARKKKEAEAIAKANQLGSLFGKTEGTNTIGDGNTQGAGTNPAKGAGGRDGRIKGLGGRNTRDGKLPEPSCEFQHYGVVVVQIRIDKDGNVLSAVNAAGTNTSDQQMIQCAINAIKNTKWTPGDGIAQGTITYTFNVK